MEYKAYTGSPGSPRTECVIAGVFEGGSLGELARQLDQACDGGIRAATRRGDVSGKPGEHLLLPVSGLPARCVLLMGLGPVEKYGRRAWRRALQTAIAALSRTRIASAALALERPALRDMSHEQYARSAAELCGAALYRVNDRKTRNRPPRPALARLHVGPFAPDGLAAARRALLDGAALAESTALLRDLGNLPANICTPTYLARTATALAGSQRKLKAKVLGERELRKLQMGSFLAVTRGSTEPPRFIVLDYRGGRRGAAPVVLVGKGITFDTGGISLKDPAAMDEMKYDMCGAATVIAALMFAALRQLPINLVGLVPTCENMPAGNAVKPGDIVTSAAGLTIEILNTDAEGRLILCDALHYARRYQPAAVIDIATLTGACVIALGHHHTGVIANDPALAGELVAAGIASDDRAWQLPLTEEYGEQLRSNFADMANVGGRDGGTITAGAFLAKFAKGMRWAHLDIAGTAWVSGAAKGATGRPLPLLAEFLLQRARD